MADTYKSSRVMADEKDEWIEIQKKTFTRWCNSHLKTRGLSIGDLFTDVSDGTLFLNLLEVIGKDTILSVCGRKFYPADKCKMDIHKLENCNLILDYLKKKELKLVNIGSSDIKDGNARLVLGLIWTVILRFAISEDGKEGLLLWCRKNTAGYDRVDVQNFSRSWSDGLAFCALIHHFRPDLIDFDKCKGQSSLDNLNLAFDVARNHLDIDRLLDAEDIADNAKPDEKSIIAYLSLYFAKFAAMAQKDAMADAIRKALNITRHHESLVAQYDAEAAGIVAWVAANSDFDKDLKTFVNTAAVKEALHQFHHFRNEVKPAERARLAAVEALLANLRLSQRNNERPLYNPATEVEDLEAKWAGLEKAEGAYEKASLELLDDFEHTDYAIQRFGNKIVKVEHFVSTNKPHFESTSYGNSISECEGLLKHAETFANQCPKYEAVIKSCHDFVSLCSVQHDGTAAAAAKLQAVENALDELRTRAKDFVAHVAATLAEQKRLLALKEKYEDELASFEFQLFDYQEVLLEPISLCNTVEAVVEVLNKTSDVSNKLKDAGGDLFALEKMRSELGSYPVDRELESVSALYHEMESNFTQRFAKLNAARAAQASKASMRADFAKAATLLVEFCSEVSRITASCGRRMSMTAQAQEGKLNELMDKFVAEGAPLMSAVETAHIAQVEAEIFNNPLTQHTVFSCRFVFEECDKLLRGAIEVNKAHILAQTSKAEMSAETAKEIRETFDKFDKDKSGHLTLKEFIDGLQGMGLVVSDQDATVEFKKRDVDGNNFLSFDEFAGYIMEQFTSGQSEEDILNSFKGLADGSDLISTAAIAQWFGADKNAYNYMLERMPGDAANKDFVSFTVQMFKQ